MYRPRWFGAQELAVNGEVDPLIAWPGLLAREAHILLMGLQLLTGGCPPLSVLPPSGRIAVESHAGCYQSKGKQCFIFFLSARDWSAVTLYLTGQDPGTWTRSYLILGQDPGTPQYVDVWPTQTAILGVLRLRDKGQCKLKVWLENLSNMIGLRER